MGNILSTPFSSWGLAHQIPHTVGNHRTVEVDFDIFESRAGHIQTGNIHSNYIPKEHISGRKCLMPRENSTKRMFTHKDSIYKIIFSNYLPLSRALNSSSEQFSPNWARFTSTPLNSALSHFKQRADGAAWTFRDKQTLLPLRVTYLFSRRSMWGNFLYFSRYKLQNYKTKLFRSPY